MQGLLWNHEVGGDGRAQSKVCSVCHCHGLLRHLTAFPWQIIAAQEEMLRKERELEEARKKLAMIRQQQYKFLPSELQEEEQN